MAENLNLKINLTGEEKVVKSVGELRRAIKAAELEALSLTMQFGEADPRVLQIRESVGKLKNQMADAADQARAFSQDSAFPAVARSVQGIASAFTAVQGAMALFGVENQAVEKTLVKLNAAMALSTGLGGVVEAIDSFKILNSMIQSSTAFKKADIVVTRLATSAQAGLATAVGVTSVSLNALKTAIASTGIGLLVVGIGYLVTKLMEWADSSESTEEANKKLNNTIERQNELLEQNVDNIDFATKKQIADARKRGASVKELRDIEVQGEKDKIAALKKAADDARLLQVDIVKNENATEEQKQKIRDNAKKAIKAYNDAVRELDLSNAEFAADQADDQRKKQQEATDKANQKRKAQKEKDNEEALQAQKDADQVQLEAIKSTLKEQQLAEFEAREKFKASKIALEKAGVKDFTLIENQLQNELNQIRDKYSLEQREKEKNFAEINLQLRKEKGLINEDQYQKELFELKIRYSELSKDVLQGNSEYIILKEKRDKGLIDEDQYQEGLISIKKKYIADVNKLSEEDNEIQIIKNKKEKGLITEQEYQQGLIDIKSKYISISESVLSTDSEFQQLQLWRDQGLINEQQYQEQLLQIKSKYLMSGSDLLNAELTNIEYNKKRKEELAGEEREIGLQKLQSQLDDLGRKNQVADLDFEQDLERIKQQRQILTDQEALELENSKLTEKERNDIKARYSAARTQLTKDEVETEKAAQQAKIELNSKYADLAGQFGSVLQQIAGKNKTLAIAGIVVEQVSAISKIISNTAAANAKSVAASPLTAGMPFVAINNISAGLSIASSVASAAKSIQQIKAQAGDAAKGSGSVSTETIKGGAAPMAAVPPQVQETQLNQASINALGNQAIRAYVIESDVTTNQQRIAAIRQRARFN